MIEDGPCILPVGSSFSFSVAFCSRRHTPPACPHALSSPSQFNMPYRVPPAPGVGEFTLVVLTDWVQEMSFNGQIGLMNVEEMFVRLAERMSMANHPLMVGLDGLGMFLERLLRLPNVPSRHLITSGFFQFARNAF